MTVPRDRSGGRSSSSVGEHVLIRGRASKRTRCFRARGRGGPLLRPEGTEYDRPFAEVDAATIGIELDDFASAIAEARPPEVDGRDGLLAVAASGPSPNRSTLAGPCASTRSPTAAGCSAAGRRRCTWFYPGHGHARDRGGTTAVSAPDGALLQPPFKQFALVVEDLDDAVRRWTDQLGIGPWTAYRLEPPG